LYPAAGTDSAGAKAATFREKNMQFTYQNPTRIIFGSGTLSHLGEVVRAHGRKALLVTGGSSTLLRERLLGDVSAHGQAGRKPPYRSLPVRFPSSPCRLLPPPVPK